MVASWLLGLLGGGLIGAAATAALVVDGRTAGISGIVSGVLRAPDADSAWRWSFVAGLLVAGVVGRFVLPGSFDAAPDARHLAMLVPAGVLVGLGTRAANGCTSGHGVCGISRLSVASLVATATFVGVGMITVAVMRVAS